MRFKVKIIYYYKRRMSDLELSDNDEVNSILDEDSDNEEEKPNSTAISLNTTLPSTIFKVTQQKENNIIEDTDDDDADIDSDDDYKSDLDDNDDDDDDNSLMNNDEVKGTSKTNSGNTKTKKGKTESSVPQTNINLPMIFEKNDSDYESDTDEDEADDYLQKFDKEQKNNYILDQHPECEIHNYNEIYNMAKVQRNKDNIIIDDLHKTIPILTKYEKTRILGLRAKQINNGAKPMVKLNNQVIDGYLIALKELEEKKIPVIIRRPIPGGASEYWHLKDLEII